MDKFRKKFLEEANEHIQKIEESLLDLEHTPDNPELIESIFRAMHTLKGGGAMFGFNRISELTHNLETIFDYLRNKEAKLSEEIINTSFKAVDQLKSLVNEDDKSDDSSGIKYDELLQTIEQHNNSISNGINITDESSEKHYSKTTNASSKTFYIYFKPNKDVLDDGTNPLFIIDELVASGNYLTVPRFNQIPELKQINPDKCYTWWEVFLATDKSIHELKDVFIFVEDDSELEIQEIAANDLISNAKFIEEVKRQSEINERIDLASLSEFTGTSDAEKEDEEAGNEKFVLNQRIKETKISSIRVDSERIDHFMNLVSELVTTQASLTLFTNKAQNSELGQISENVQKLTRDLRDLAFNIALIPIDHVVTRFQRLVRDVSKELNKNIDFITEGTDTELDKNIIESLSDPILHILRNSVDHGIEMPEHRKQLGKPENGKISFKAFYSGANVHIQISDDGAGMDPEKIRQKAIENKIINSETELSRGDTFDLVFLPGFSTSKKVTGLSGRGVGMDVVKRKITEIRGAIEIDSEVNVGTTITIKIPLTLSIIDGLLVSVDMEKYLIPLTAIHKIYPINHSQLGDKFHDLVKLDEELIPYFNLRKEFDIQDINPEEEHAVVISYEDRKVALIADNVIGEYQAVLKSLGKHYKNQEMVCGATILGDGTVALVMDTNMMVNSFVNDKVLVDNL